MLTEPISAVTAEFSAKIMREGIFNSRRAVFELLSKIRKELLKLGLESLNCIVIHAGVGIYSYITCF